jgi:transposase InsO family protein
VHAELRAKGRRVGRKRVERLMRDQGLRGRRRRRFCRTTDSAHSMPVAPNVLDRKFDVEVANQAWVGDVTYIPTDEGWLYLAVLIDLFSRRVVGWATSATNDRALALAALQKATRSRCPSPGLLHHTDRGSALHGCSDHHVAGEAVALRNDKQAGAVHAQRGQGAGEARAILQLSTTTYALVQVPGRDGHGLARGPRLDRSTLGLGAEALIVGADTDVGHCRADVASQRTLACHHLPSARVPE